MSVLEIKNLTKKYGNNLAVDDLSLTVEEGKVYGLLGPNGAGKSTTMNVMTGYIGADAGTILIDGYDIVKEPEKAKAAFGYLPEMPPLYMDMTVEEYLKFVASIKKVKNAAEDIEEAINLTRIDQVRGKIIRNLSKGYRQRVGIAQALIGNPKLIILDEPTVGLDPKQIIEIRQLIRELKYKHTVILSSHILTEISEVCDQIFIISRGKLVASGTEEELTELIQGDRVVSFEARGDELHVSQIITGISGVKGYNIENHENEGYISVEVNSDLDNDIREDIFFAFADKKIPIISMREDLKSLEDVFIELTDDYVDNSKKKKKKKDQKQYEVAEEMTASKEMESATQENNQFSDTRVNTEEVQEEK